MVVGDFSVQMLEVVKRQFGDAGRIVVVHEEEAADKSASHVLLEVESTFAAVVLREVGEMLEAMENNLAAGGSAEV